MLINYQMLFLKCIVIQIPQSLQKVLNALQIFLDLNHTLGLIINLYQ